jgi:hypothetical protein
MFTGQENHNITLEDATVLTTNYRNTLMSLFGGVKGGFFGRDAIQTVLDQEDVVGLRFYFGLSESTPPLPQMVIVGVNALGNDITAGVVLDKAKLCPPYCSISNVLNS